MAGRPPHQSKGPAGDVSEAVSGLGKMPLPPSVQLTPVPDDECVHVEWDPLLGQFVVVNSLSCQRHPLGSGFEHADLVVEDGVAVICAYRPGVADPESFVVEELLHKKMFRDPTGDLWFRDSSDMDSVAKNLVDERRRFSICTWHVRGELGTIELTFARFEHGGFFGQVLRWSLHELYDVLGLESYQGRRWVWCNRCMESWRRWLLNLWPSHGGCIVKAQTSSANGQVATREDEQRCLPWPGADTGGFVGIVLRLCAAPSQQSGGLGKASERNRAKCLLCRLLESSQGSQWALILMLHDESGLRWPRCSAGARVATYTVDEAGDLVVSSQEPPVVIGGHGAAGESWWEALGLGGRERVGLVELLERLSAWRPRPTRRRDCLLGQVLLQVALRLDKKLSGREEAMGAMGSGTLVESCFDWRRASSKQVAIGAAGRPHGGLGRICQITDEAPSHRGAMRRQVDFTSAPEHSI